MVNRSGAALNAASRPRRLRLPFPPLIRSGGKRRVAHVAPPTATERRSDEQRRLTRCVCVLLLFIFVATEELTES